MTEIGNSILVGLGKINGLGLFAWVSWVSLHSFGILDGDRCYGSKSYDVLWILIICIDSGDINK